MEEEMTMIQIQEPHKQFKIKQFFFSSLEPKGIHWERSLWCDFMRQRYWEGITRCVFKNPFWKHGKICLRKAPGDPCLITSQWEGQGRAESALCVILCNILLIKFHSIWSICSESGAIIKYKEKLLMCNRLQDKASRSRLWTGLCQRKLTRKPELSPSRYKSVPARTPIHSWGLTETVKDTCCHRRWKMVFACMRDTIQPPTKIH